MLRIANVTRIVFLVGLIGLHTYRLHAQIVVPVGPDESVRVTRGEDAGWIRGTYAGLADDTLVIVVDGQRVAFPLIAVEAVERRVGVQRHTWKGAGAGALSGALAGAVLGAVTHEECTPTGELFSCFWSSTETEDMVTGAVLGLVAGSLIGGVIGTFIVAERWEPARLQVDLAVRMDGLSVGVQLRSR